MTDPRGKPTILCISTYEKGQPFLRQVARLGCDVVLLTVDKLKDGDWPRESLNKLITMPEDMTPGQVLNTVSYMARGIRFDRVVALDELRSPPWFGSICACREWASPLHDFFATNWRCGFAGSNMVCRCRSSRRSSTATIFAAS